MLLNIVVGALVALAAWELTVQYLHRPWLYEGECRCGRTGYRPGCRSWRVPR